MEKCVEFCNLCVESLGAQTAYTWTCVCGFSHCNHTETCSHCDVQNRRKQCSWCNGWIRVERWVEHRSLDCPDKPMSIPGVNAVSAANRQQVLKTIHHMTTCPSAFDHTTRGGVISAISDHANNVLRGFVPVLAQCPWCEKDLEESAE